MNLVIDDAVEVKQAKADEGEKRRELGLLFLWPRTTNMTYDCRANTLEGR